jgi:cytochrome c-type biogenesis protein CcmH/NrfG
MEKIIFFGLAIPILGFILYLGASAIMKGFTAKEANRSEKEDKNEKNNFSDNKEHLSDELNKLNDLLKSGVLTQEEFEKAKKKILDN